MAAAQGGYANLAAMTKPIPLVCFLLWSSGEMRNGYARSIQAGLVMSLVGDMLLAGPQAWFLGGLIFFLIAHLCYIRAFSLACPQLAPMWTLPFLAWGIGMMLLLLPGLGDLTAYVPIYTLAICAMLWRAMVLARVKGDWRPLIGALSFGLSDSMLAIDRFHTPFATAHLWIMVTYWLGQGCIARSMRS